MNALKRALVQMKINGVLEKFLPITDTLAVGVEFDENNNITKTLAEKLTEMSAAIEQADTGVTEDDIKTECDKLYKKIMGLTDEDTTIDEAYDTLVEVADYITEHGEAAAKLVSDIADLKSNLDSVTEQLESLIESGGTTVEASETNGNIKVDGEEVEVYRNPGVNVHVAKNAAELETVSDKMTEGDLVFTFVNAKGVAMADFSNLQDTINGVTGGDDAPSESGYTADSWAAYQEALAAANAVLADENSTQEQVNEALTALLTALDGLTAPPAMVELKDANDVTKRKNRFIGSSTVSNSETLNGQYGLMDLTGSSNDDDIFYSLTEKSGVCQIGYYRLNTSSAHGTNKGAVPGFDSSKAEYLGATYQVEEVN